MICLAGGMEGPLASEFFRGGAGIHAVVDRLKGLFPGRRPSARRLLEIPEETLRDVGLSRSKVLSVQDLAEKSVSE